MAIAATPAGGGGGLSSADRALIDSISTLSTKVTEIDTRLEIEMPFINTLQFTYKTPMTYRINSVLGTGDQVVTLPGYTLGTTITPDMSLVINVDILGTATLIGERIYE